MRTFTSIILAVALAACAPGTGPDSGNPGDPSVAWTGPEVTIRIIDVMDGDSVRAEVEGRTVEVRLDGINAPERDECWGTEARRALETAVRTGETTLAVTGFDQFDRRLGYLVVDGTVVNAELLDDGHAIATSSDHPLVGDFRSIGSRAVQAQRGMWSPSACNDHEVPRVEIDRIEYNPRGPDADNLEREFVVIRARESVDLDGWTLRDESSQHRYVFPAGTVLQPNETLTVRTGCQADDGDLAWCAGQPVWNNGGDTGILMTPRGTVVDVFTYGSP